jgi:hypothetical protein
MLVSVAASCSRRHHLRIHLISGRHALRDRDFVVLAALLNRSSHLGFCGDHIAVFRGAQQVGEQAGVVHVHAPQVAQAGIALFIADVDLADVAGQDVGLFVFGRRAQLFVFKQLVIGQHCWPSLFSMVASVGEKVNSPAWFTRRPWSSRRGSHKRMPVSSSCSVEKALVEHIHRSIGVGGLFLAVVLVKGEEQRHIGRVGPVQQRCHQAVVLAHGPQLVILIHHGGIAKPPAHGTLEALQLRVRQLPR